jgi:hypothetical protein
LEGYGLERVVTSEEPKAAETAEIVAEHLGLAWTSASGLHEHDRTGATFGTREDFELAAKTFFDNPGRLVWAMRRPSRPAHVSPAASGPCSRNIRKGICPWWPTVPSTRSSSRSTEISMLSISGAGSVCHPYTLCPFPASGCRM